MGGIDDTFNDSNTRKRRYHAPFRKLGVERTRKHILDSAAVILRKQGEANLTFEGVSEHAGVSLRTLFRHFSNRQQLLEEAIALCNSTSTDRPTDWPSLLAHTADITESLGELAKTAALSDENWRLAVELLSTSGSAPQALLVSLLLSPLAWHFLQRHHALSNAQMRECIAHGLELLGADFHRPAPSPTYSDDEFID